MASTNSNSSNIKLLNKVNLPEIVGQIYTMGPQYNGLQCYIYFTVSSIISSVLKLFSVLSMGKVLIAIVFFVPKHEQGLLSRKLKKGRNRALQPNFLGAYKEPIFWSLIIVCLYVP